MLYVHRNNISIEDMKCDAVAPALDGANIVYYVRPCDILPANTTISVAYICVVTVLTKIVNNIALVVD